MKHLLKMSDLTPGEVTHILDVADRSKPSRKPGAPLPCWREKAWR